MMRCWSIGLFCACLVCAARAPLFAAGQDPEPAPNPALAEARNEYAAGRYNRAVDTANAEEAKYPNDAALNFLIGQCYYQLRDYSRSVSSLERAVQSAPDNSEYHDWLGRAYGRRAEEGRFFSALGEARRAHREFELAVELDKQNFLAQRDLIRYEMYAPVMAGGGDERALKDIDALDKIDATEGELARGEFLSAKKRLAEADAVFQKILDSKPAAIGVYFEVAEYYRDREDATKMAQAVDTAQSIGPTDRRLPYYRGVILVLSHDTSGQAEKLLRTYLTTVPEDGDLPSHASAREWLGKMYEEQGKFSEAAQEYRRALDLDPRDKELSDSLRRVEKK